MPNLMRWVAAPILILSAFVICPAQSEDKPQNEIEIRGTFSIPSGEANFSTAGNPGTTIDFERDFDFKNEFGFALRYVRRSKNGKHKFGGDFAKTTWSRTRTLSRSFTFLGETYVANLEASSDLKLTTVKGMYAYRWGNEKFRMGPMVDMGVVKTSLEITGTTNNGTRTKEGTINKFAATIGYDLDYDPSSMVNVFHNLGWIKFKRDNLFHTEGGVKVFLSRNFGVVGGYKAERYKFEDGDNFITIRKHGPFFGGLLRF